MRAKLLFIFTTLIITANMAVAQPNVPTLTVDTLVNLSKTGGGVAGGALFLPDGNIIALWKSIPHVIDSKTGEVIRRMDTVHSSLLHEPRLTTNGLRLGGISMGPKLNIWDVPSGKIIFQTNKKMMSFCFSPDGTKMYVTLPNDADNPGTIVIYDMATFEEIERLSYTNMTWGDKIDISPDGQTLAVSVGYKVNETFNNKFILINLNDKKNYTTIESLKLDIYSMEFSPDGKQIAFHYNDGDGDNYIYIYNLETKEKKYIREQELEALFGIKFYYISPPLFVSNDIVLFSCSDLSDKFNYYLSWDLFENKINNLIDFKYNQSIDLKDNMLLFCNDIGVIGFLNKNVVHVKDLEIQKDNYLSYKNNQFEYNTEKAFFVESTIYDINGKLIANLGSQTFVIGKNLIQVNQNLPIGVYILTINDKTNQFSYKFIVE